MATSLKILVAEDEPLNALALRSQLEALGHVVVGPAANGDEAVKLAGSGEPDLAILDIRMPGLSGLDAAEEIFRFQPLPIILLSGYSDAELITRASRVPVFHFLVKPVSLDDLVPAISVARSRFKEWHQLKGDASSLERRIEERRLIDSAKAVVMERKGLSENDAYRLLQRESQTLRQPMVEVARTVLLANTLLHGTGY